MRYAEEIGDESLQACLAKLKSWEQRSRRPCEIELCPYSFLFKQRYADGSVGIGGGLVYHGTPDRLECYTMNHESLWQTHT